MGRRLWRALALAYAVYVSYTVPKVLYAIVLLAVADAAGRALLKAARGWLERPFAHRLAIRLAEAGQAVNSFTCNLGPSLCR